MSQTRLRPELKKLAAIFLAVVLALQGVTPSVSLAATREVDMNNHTSAAAGATVIKDIKIDGVDKPVAGLPLDREATVTAANGITWNVPVLWVRDDLVIYNGTIAEEGHTYLPTIVFVVPKGYVLAQDVYTVTLSDSLTELFGTQEVISVYEASSGITHILPAPLKDLLARARRTQSAEAATQAASTSYDDATASDQDEWEEEEDYDDDDMTMVELYCANTALDVLSDEDLQWLIELIIDYLEPQAVTLLLNNFPSLREGAAKGEIGREISLYIYYDKGDNDGKLEHNINFDALAFVSADAFKVDGELKYCYMLGVNTKTLIKRDENGNPIIDPTTQTYILMRDGMDIDTLRNTIVHEIFHALMDDYNRTGMAGAVTLEDMQADENNRYIVPGAGERVRILHFPQWFIEGTASAVENVYQLRYDTFQLLRRHEGADGKNGTGTLNPEFTSQLLVDNYVYGNYEDGRFAYFSIDFSEGGKDSNDNTIDTHASRYVTGYLATLYLAELAARHAYSGQSSVKVVNGVTTVDSDMLRTGLDLLLKWMHEGSTLDSLINSLSTPKEGGEPRYKDADDFQRLFIKGPAQGSGYLGDGDAQAFVVDFLNYMLYVESKLPEGEHPNGSILFDFADRYTSPIGGPEKTTSPYLQIADSNSAIPSTVKSNTPNIGGGKSSLPASAAATADNAQTQEAQLPIAAKTAPAAPTNQGDSASNAAASGATASVGTMETATPSEAGQTASNGTDNAAVPTVAPAPASDENAPAGSASTANDENAPAGSASTASDNAMSEQGTVGDGKDVPTATEPAPATESVPVTEPVAPKETVAQQSSEPAVPVTPVQEAVEPTQTTEKTAA